MKATCLPASKRKPFVFFPILLLFICYAPMRLQAQVMMDSLGVVKQVDSLLKEAKSLADEWRNQDALPFLQQASDIAKQNWGENNIQYAISLHRLAICYSNLLQFDTAEAICRNVISVRARILGVNHPDYAHSLTVLGSIQTNKREYIEAEQNYLEALSILGDTSRYYAPTAFNLAQLYNRQERFEKASKVYLNCKKALPKNEIGYVVNLIGLGSLYENLADFGNARIQYEEAQKFFEMDDDPNRRKSIYYAEVLKGFGRISTNIGDYTKAEKYIQEAIAIRKEIEGIESGSLLYDFNNLALVYKAMGAFLKSDSLFDKSLMLIENLIGKDNIDYATVLTNKGNLFCDLNNFEKAKSLFSEAKDIKVKIGGIDNQDYAYSLLSLGNVYYLNNEFDSAQIYFKEADAIFQKATGKSHPNYGDITQNLALSYYAQRIQKPANEYFIASNLAHRNLITKAADYFTENEMLRYLHLNEQFFDIFYSFSQTENSNAVSNRASFDNALFLNGFLLDNARRLARSIDTASFFTRDTFERWQGCLRRLAKEYTKPISEREDVAKLEVEAENYKKALTRGLPAFGATRQVPHWKDVCDRLRLGEVAIEFIHYRFYTPKATDSTMYAALVLLPGDTCPHFVPLCEQRPLDSLLHQKYQDKRYARQSGAASLYSLLWQPIEPLLKGVRTIYYAPSGALHSINLDAIALDTLGDNTLIDKYKLLRLGSTRQLVSPVTTKIADNDALLFGGIRYESDSMAIQNENRKNHVAMRGSGKDGLPEPADSLQQIRALEPLPGTQTEVEFIKHLLVQKKFNARVFTGFGASEEAFKYLADSISASGASARVLHLATHGYFFPDPNSSELPATGFGDEPVFRISEHPFLRSGLVLAGGDHAWQTGKPFKEGMEDGILTAYEISAMYLPNTELVVLSACETGLGDVAGNEGVYGLQRAFKIAGVKYLIMSLWAVHDDTAKDLMSAFYTNWLKEKMDIPAAFRAAQLEMKKKYKDPEKWAGFVLVQ